jgi:hypothetical protein
VRSVKRWVAAVRRGCRAGQLMLLIDNQPTAPHVQRPHVECAYLLAVRVGYRQGAARLSVGRGVECHNFGWSQTSHIDMDRLLARMVGIYAVPLLS